MNKYVNLKWQYLNRTTICTVLYVVDNVPFTAISHVTRFAKDRNVKEVARRHTLKLALEDPNFSREDRAFIWAEYFNRKPVVKYALPK